MDVVARGTLRSTLMRRGVLLLFSALFLAKESAAAPPPLDRIVAVVDESPITLSEVRARSRPHLRQLKESSGNKPPAPAALDTLYNEMLQRIIDERLVASEADAHHLSVTSDEIDKALEHVAAGNKLTVEQLLAEVDKMGMSRTDYRDEVRRQLLDGKWTMLVVRSAVQVSRTDERAFTKALDEARRKELARLRTTHFVEVRK